MTRPRRLRTESVQSPLETYLREINETPLTPARVMAAIRKAQQAASG